MGGKSWFGGGKADKNDIEMAENNRGKGVSTNTRAAEEEDTEYKPFNWKRFFFRPKYIPIHILAILIGVFTIVVTMKHDQVVDALKPFSLKVKDIPAGWLIFVAILVIISFPPLFGHEIVALLAGVVYGLWEGFAIVAAGTFIGEGAFSPVPPLRILELTAVQLEHGTHSSCYCARKQKRRRGRILPMAQWRDLLVTGASGCVSSCPLCFN